MHSTFSVPYCRLEVVTCRLPHLNLGVRTFISFSTSAMTQPEIVAKRTSDGFIQCGWAGCQVWLYGEIEWIKHVSVHVFNQRPGEPLTWLGPPELQLGLQQMNGIFFLQPFVQPSINYARSRGPRCWERGRRCWEQG